MIDLDELMQELRVYVIEKKNGKLHEWEAQVFMLYYDKDLKQYILKVVMDD